MIIIIIIVKSGFLTLVFENHAEKHFWHKIGFGMCELWIIFFKMQKLWKFRSSKLFLKMTLIVGIHAHKSDAPDSIW